MAHLCPACAAASDAWLDYKLPRRPVFANHAAYDDTAGGIRDRARARTDEWRRTIRDARALIRANCEKGKHAG